MTHIQLRHLILGCVLFWTLLILGFSTFAQTVPYEKLPLTCGDTTVIGAVECPKAQRTFTIPQNATPVSTTRGWQPWESASADDILICTLALASGSGTDACPAVNKIRVPYCDVAFAECDIEPAPDPTEPPPANNTAVLTWTAPTRNTDDSPLTDLAGYYLYSGTTQANGSAPTARDLTLLRTIADRTATSVTVSGLSWGAYYFALSAYNSALKESERSNVLRVEFVEPVRIPNAPSGITITGTLSLSAP